MSADIQSYVTGDGYRIFYSPRGNYPIAVIDHPEDKVRVEHTSVHLTVFRLDRDVIYQASFRLEGYSTWQFFEAWHGPRTNYPYWDPHPPGYPPTYASWDNVPDLARQALDVYASLRGQAFKGLETEYRRYCQLSNVRLHAHHG